MLELVNEIIGNKGHGQRYNREILIEKIQQFEKENGRPPKEKDFLNNKKYPSYKTCEKEFGTWNNALKAAGLIQNNHIERSRQAEIQTLSEFKTDGAIDLSGENRHSLCDGICPKGEKFDTKSSSLIRVQGSLCWVFGVTQGQLEEVDYLFLRAYKDKDFTKPPMYRWRVPIEFMEDKTAKIIYKDELRGKYNIRTMKIYELRD